MASITYDNHYISKIDEKAMAENVAKKVVEYIWIDGSKKAISAFMDELAKDYSIYQYNAYGQDRRSVQPKQTMLLSAGQCDLYYWDNAGIMEDGYMRSSLSFFNGFCDYIYKDVIDRLAVTDDELSVIVQFKADYDELKLMDIADKFVIANSEKWQEWHGMIGKFKFSGYINANDKYYFKKKNSRKYAYRVSAKGIYQHIKAREA